MLIRFKIVLVIISAVILQLTLAGRMIGAKPDKNQEKSTLVGLTYTKDDVSCPGGNDGKINLEITTSNSIQSILWDNGATTEDISDLTAGDYTVTVTDQDDSQTLKITINEPIPLAISIQPADMIACNEGEGIFEATAANGTGFYTFQWQRKKPFESSFSDIPLADMNVTYPDPGRIQIENTGNSDAPDGTQYQVIISDGCTSILSAPATLHINEITDVIPSVLTPSKTDVELCEGENFSYQVTTSGTMPTSYQWEKQNGSGVWENITDNANISGSTSDKLVIAAATPSENGEYRVTASFPSTYSDCSTNSEIRKLTVFPKIIAPVCFSDQIICENKTPSPLNASSATGGSGSFLYQWQSSTDNLSWTNIPGETSLNYAPPALATTTYFQLVATDNGTTSCGTEASNQVSITVNPTPTVTIPSDKTYCLGETTQVITLTGTPSGVIFDISGGTSIGLNDQTGITQIPAFTAITGSANVTITPRANGCIGTPVSFNITVLPLPNIQTPTSSQTICSGESTNISLSSSTANTTFTWVVINSGSVTGASDGSGNLISQVLENKTAAISMVTYQITASANGCEGATRNFNVTVHPEVTATISNGVTICQDDPQPDITFTAVGGTPPYTFTYNINGGNQQQVIANSGNTAIINVPTDIADVFSYNLVSVAGSTNCPYPQTETATITINPKPSLTSTLTPPGICSNEAFTYLPTSNVPGTTFNWTRAAVPGISNPADSGADNPDEILENTTSDPIPVTYAYTLTSPNGCTNVENITVMVTPTPHLTSSTNGLTVCSGTPFSYTPASDVSGTNFPWTRTAVTGITNPASSGIGNPNEILINTTSSPVGVTYTYTLESNDCANPVTYSVPVVVVPAPNVSASASQTTICPGSSLNLFSSSDITTTQPPILLSESFNGSTNSWTSTNTSSGGTPSDAEWTLRPDNYNWNGNSYQSNDNSQFYFSNSQDQGGGTTRTTLESPVLNSNGYTSLELNFWHYYNDRGSSSGDYAYIEVSTDGTNWTTIQTYNTDRGSRTNFTNETISLDGYIGIATLSLRFRYLATNDRYWAIDNVTISGTPSAVANILWTSNTSSWTATEANPTNVSPTETTTYTVTYTDPDTGCDGSASTTVAVYPTPDATIHADYCIASPKIRLTTGSFASYNWQPLPVGETNGNQFIDVDIAGIYTVTVTDANGCSGTASINVSNEYVTNGDFSAGNTGFTTPPAANGNQYTYVPDVGGNAELYPEGLYGVGTNGQNYHNNFWGKDHTSGSGNFLIVNGFPGSPQPVVWQETLSVEPNTDYYFSAWSMSLNSAGNDAQLQFSINGVQLGTIADLTLIAGVSNNSNTWQPEGRFYGIWNSGSSTTAIVQIIDLQTALGGNDFGIDDISFGILDPSPAEIAPTSNNEICSGGTIELYANVSGGKDPITFLWEFPNGLTSTDENPVIPDADETYDGTYTLTVSDWYGCAIAPETVDVRVYPPATVDAGTDQPFGCSNNTSFLLNGSMGGTATASTWKSSGTGSFDNPNSLNAIYTASPADITAGTVTLTLTTDDPIGPCTAVSDDMVITISPSPELTVDVVHPPCYGENTGSATTSVTNGSAPYDYLWSDGQTTANATGLTVGPYSVTVTDAKGCSVTKTFDVVEPPPLVIYPASFTPPTCYGGNDGTATINATGGTEPYVYEWDAAAGNQTAKTAINLGVGVYMFTVTDINGCNITTDFVLITQPDPPTLTCPPNPDPVQAAIGATSADVILTDPIYDPVCQTISWVMSGATVVATPVDGIVPSPYTFNVGTTTIEYTTLNTAGEPLSCSFDVVVIPNDPPDIECTDPPSTTATTNHCSASISISVPTVNAGANITWDWIMTGATSGSGTGPLPDPYAFNVGTTYIEWTATNISGADVCKQTIVVTDNQAPEFTAPDPVVVCVKNITSATYDAIIRPEYYEFEAGDTQLDLDLSNFTDNCDLTCDVEIQWQIELADGTLIPSTGHYTGQPSTYPSPIQFPGDGITFLPVVHLITYWIKDCNNNSSASQQTTVTVNPRPQLTSP